MADVMEQSVNEIQAAVDELLSRGKKRGYVTWEEMNEILPDDAIDPSQLETIMMRLEDAKIDTLDEIEAGRFERKRQASAPKAAEEPGPVATGTAGQPPPEAVVIEETGVKRIDDPVRMYLTQMGEIPLLTRDEEIRLAKKIELTRMAFRQKVLESDYCARLAVDILQQVHDGTLPFDRTMKISTSEHAAKSRISARIPVNLETVRALIELNEQAWEQMTTTRMAAAKRRELMRQVRERRRKISKLLEELSLRASSR